MPWPWSASPAPPPPGPTPVQAEVVAVLPASPPPPPEEVRPSAPPAPDRFPALEQRSVEELQQLQANTTAAEDLILEHASVQDLAKKLQAAREENKQLADCILRSEPAVNEAGLQTPRFEES
ncbi:unnamed protein product [Effrenium voratum]|nr:unnamed protein product [Effrenium voratum]